MIYLEPKVICNGTGIDLRKNYHEIDNLPADERDQHYPEWDKIKENMKAVACFMTTQELIKNSSDDGYKLSTQVPILKNRIKLMFGVGLAKSEKFRKEPAPGSSSGFLVKMGVKNKKNKVFTAGHCVRVRGTSLPKSDAELKEIRVVFNFRSNKTKFDKDDVYTIKKLKSYSFNHENYEKGFTGKYHPDHALLVLDRPVVGIEPIEVSFQPKLGNIYAIGCPTGTAPKYAPGRIQEINSDIIKGNTDTFGGNSGGPVCDATTHKAIAILVNGPKDFERVKVTGKKGEKMRVISYRITPEMVKDDRCAYPGYQPITLKMFERTIAQDKMDDLNEYLHNRDRAIDIDERYEILRQMQKKDPTNHNIHLSPAARENNVIAVWIEVTEKYMKTSGYQKYYSEGEIKSIADMYTKQFVSRSITKEDAIEHAIRKLNMPTPKELTEREKAAKIQADIEKERQADPEGFERRRKANAEAAAQFVNAITKMFAKTKEQLKDIAELDQNLKQQQAMFRIMLLNQKQKEDEEAARPFILATNAIIGTFDRFINK